MDASKKTGTWTLQRQKTAHLPPHQTFSFIEKPSEIHQV
jgi:hypothetical protein